MNIRQVKSSSAAFYIASNRCLEERRIGPESLEIILVPGIVCAVFSIELGLKAIILGAGGKPSGHKLSQLFAKLGPWVQNEIIRAVGLEQQAFLAELAAISDAFVQWRYVYEHTEVTMSMGFLDKLAVATQAAVAHAVDV